MVAERPVRRIVAVLAPEPYRTMAMSYLEAEDHLVGSIVSEMESADAWGALAIGSTNSVEELRAALPGVTVIARVPHDGISSQPAEIVADRSLARLLSASRRVEETDALVRAGGWRPAEVPVALHGSTVAIIGRGTESAATARRLLALSCDVVLCESVADWAALNASWDWTLILPSAPELTREGGNARDDVHIIDARDVSGVLERVATPTHHGIRHAIRDLAAAAGEPARRRSG